MLPKKFSLLNLLVGSQSFVFSRSAIDKWWFEYESILRDTPTRLAYSGHRAQKTKGAQTGHHPKAPSFTEHSLHIASSEHLCTNWMLFLGSILFPDEIAGLA